MVAVFVLFVGAVLGLFALALDALGATAYQLERNFAIGATTWLAALALVAWLWRAGKLTFWVPIVWVVVVWVVLANVQQ